MASVDWHQKCHGGTEAKAILRHSDKDMRIKDNHKNKHIDKSLTGYNWQMYQGYNATCDRLNAKLDELDSQPKANKRKDRVTMISLETPAPDGLPLDKFHEWHMKVLDILRAMYGKDLYIVNSYEHADEIHDYRDASTGEQVTSRAHAHDCVVPLVDGKLNGKAFSSRKNITRLNKEIQAMTYKDYGFNFMTGEKTKSKASVDELKQRSEIQELKHQLQEEARKTIEESHKDPIENKEFRAYLANIKFKSGKTAEQWLDETYQQFQQEQITKVQAEIEAKTQAIIEQAGNDDIPPVRHPKRSNKHDGKHPPHKTTLQENKADNTAEKPVIPRHDKQDISISFERYKEACDSLGLHQDNSDEEDLQMGEE